MNLISSKHREPHGQNSSRTPYLLPLLCSYHLHCAVGANLEPVPASDKAFAGLHNLKQLYLDPVVLVTCVSAHIRKYGRKVERAVGRLEPGPLAHVSIRAHQVLDEQCFVMHKKKIVMFTDILGYSDLFRI